MNHNVIEGSSGLALNYSYILNLGKSVNINP